MPAPKPLPHAVAAGVFGEDETGPVHPSTDEVLDITRNHAETVIELLEELQESKRRKLSQLRLESVEDQLHKAIADYAEDFGEAAREQLLAYCHRQFRLRDAPAGGLGRG